MAPDFQMKILRGKQLAWAHTVGDRARVTGPALDPGQQHPHHTMLSPLRNAWKETRLALPLGLEWRQGKEDKDFSGLFFTAASTLENAVFAFSFCFHVLFLPFFCNKRYAIAFVKSRLNWSHTLVANTRLQQKIKGNFLWESIGYTRHLR